MLLGEGELDTMKRSARHLIVLLGLLTLVLQARSAHALGSYLTAFNTRYPASTLGSSMGCALCHPNNNTSSFNAYGNAMKAKTGTSDARLAAIESLDSDGDGFTNLKEIQANTDPSSASSHPVSPTPTPTATPTPTPKPTATPTPTPTPTPTATPTPTPRPTVTPTPTPTVTPTPTPRPTVTPTPTPRPTVTPTPTPRPTVTPTPTPRPTPTPTPSPTARVEIQVLKRLDDLHFEALTASAMAEKRSSHRSLVYFARNFSARELTELNRIQRYLLTWFGIQYTPRTDPTFDQWIARLNTLAGNSFDIYFLQIVVSYDNNEITQGQQILNLSGGHAELKSFLKFIADDDRAEIRVAQAWIRAWSGSHEDDGRDDD
jgi:uncharacterized protein (DUF305 family)